jgi:hypothetical protein
MPNLNAQFDAEVDLNSAFDSEQDLSAPKTTSSVLGERLSGLAGGAVDKLKGMGESVVQGTEDFLRGSAQGATLGFADELYGGGSALLKSLDQGSIENFLNNYRAAQKASEAAFSESKERSPWLYGGGELFGAMGAGAATAGAGLASGARLGLREAAAQGRSVLAKELAKLAATGAVMGGTQAAGLSKGTLGSEELTADTAGGALAGGVLTPVIAGAGSMLSPSLQRIAEKSKAKVSEYVDDSPFLKQVLRSYDKGKAGEAINQGRKYREISARRYMGDVEDEASKILSAKELLGKEQGDILSAAGAKGTKVNVLESAKEASKELAELLGRPAVGTEAAVEGTQEFLKVVPGTSDFITSLNKFVQGELTPEATWELRNQVTKLAKSKNLPFGAKEILNKLQTSIKDSLEEAVPDFATAAGVTKSYNKAVIDPLKKLGITPEETGYVKSLTPEQTKEKVTKSLSQIIKQERAPGQMGDDQKITLTRVIDNLKKLESERPGLMEKLGFGSVKEFEEGLISKADDKAIDRQILGYDPQSSPTTNIWSILSLGGATTGRGVPLAAANTAGRVVKATAPAATKLKNLSKGMFELPEDALREVADTLGAVPGFANLADALNRGMNDKNKWLKNAAIFSILQNPKARLLISGEDVTETDK